MNMKLLSVVTPQSIYQFQTNSVESSTESSLVIKNSCYIDYNVLFHHKKACILTRGGREPIEGETKRG